jgi:hypothetical protein
VHAPLAALVAAPSLATLPCQHATCITLDSTMLAFSVALPSPSPPSKRGISRWGMAREEAQSAVGMSVASHRKHSTTVMPRAHTHTTLLAPPTMRTLRIWYNEEGT